MNNDKITNLNYLNELSNGDTNFSKEIAMMFLEQLVEFKHTFRKQLESEEYEALGITAHTAKSSVMIFGMDNLGNILKELHIKTQKLEDINSYEEYIIYFETIADKATKEISDYLNSF